MLNPCNLAAARLWLSLAGKASRIPVSATVSLHVFRSAMRHFHDALHCDALCSASAIPTVHAAASEAYDRAVRALLTELKQLDDMGSLERIEAFLNDTE